MKKANISKQIIIFLTLLIALMSKVYGAQQGDSNIDDYPSATEDNEDNVVQIHKLSQQLDDATPVTDTPHLQPSQSRLSEPIITLTRDEWVRIQQQLNQSRPFINRAKDVKEVTLIDTAKAIILGLIISYLLKIIYNNFYTLSQRVTNLMAEDIETFQANNTEEEYQLVAQVAANNLLNRIFAGSATVIIMNLLTNLLK